MQALLQQVSLELGLLEGAKLAVITTVLLCVQYSLLPIGLGPLL